MPFGPASLLGVERFSEESEAPLELLPGDDDAKKEQIIRAVYKQVLGNAYVMAVSYTHLTLPTILLV